MEQPQEKIGREGALYAEPVEWILPTGEKLIRKLVFNAKNFNLHWNNLRKAATEKPIIF